MRVHHLNCGTMRPLVGEMVAHVLLLETDRHLVLVDTGFGLADVADPSRLGPSRHLLRPALREDQTAVRQVEGLGLDPRDVRHVVLTHFDLDHVGGLADFPEAAVHVTSQEARAAVHEPTLRESTRYRSVQWAHGPHLVEHDTDGERWRGFEATRELSDVAPGVVMVSVPGHTRGHAAVGIDLGDRWLLHCGDAYFDRGSITGEPVPRLLRATERMLAHDHRRVAVNQARLAELALTQPDDLELFCAHDGRELARFTS